MTAASHEHPTDQKKKKKKKKSLALTSAGSCRHRRCRRGASTTPKRLEPNAVVEAADFVFVAATQVVTAAVVAALVVPAAVVPTAAATAAVFAAFVLTHRC